MFRILSAAIVCFVAGNPVRADILPLITPIPTEYTPGVPITFTLTAPGLVDFTGFNVDLIVTTADPNSVPNLTLAAPQPDPAQYPFGATGTYQSSVTPGLQTNQLDLNVNGNAPPFQSVDTVAGVNDLLTTVTLTPGLGLTGSIIVEVNPQTDLFSTSGDVRYRYSPPPPFEIDLAPQPVPAPAGWLMLGMGGLILVLGRRRVGLSSG